MRNGKILSLCFILLFMIISALPNLYSDKVNHSAYTNNSTQSETNSSAQDINSLLLTSNNLMVDEIKTSAERLNRYYLKK